jgi:hypothetical protein
MVLYSGYIEKDRTESKLFNDKSSFVTNGSDDNFLRIFSLQRIKA